MVSICKAVGSDLKSSMMTGDVCEITTTKISPTSTMSRIIRTIMVMMMMMMMRIRANILLFGDQDE